MKQAQNGLIHNTKIVTFKRGFCHVFLMVSWSRTTNKSGNSHGKLIKIVGNALAEETGALPKPGETLEFEDEVGSDLPTGRNHYDFNDPRSAYCRAESKLAELKKRVEESGVLTDFELEPATGKAIKVELADGKPWKSKRTCSITVRNYSVSEDLLFKKIDALKEEGHLKEIAEATGPDKAGLVYSMMAELLTYGPGVIRPTNTEKVFGLGNDNRNDNIYADLHDALSAELGKMEKKLEGSWWAELSGSRCRLLRWIGSRYRESGRDKMREYRETKEARIEALRGKFSCGYKAMKNAIKIEGGNSPGLVYHVPRMA